MTATNTAAVTPAAGAQRHNGETKGLTVDFCYNSCFGRRNLSNNIRFGEKPRPVVHERQRSTKSGNHTAELVGRLAVFNRRQYLFRTIFF